MMKRGFTLIELLIVIAIIGTLTAILLPNFMGARERAADTRKIQELGVLKNALRSYYNDHQAYPVPDGDKLPGTFVMTGLSEIEYTYAQAGGDTDRFQLSVTLGSGAGDEDINSQARCGVAVPVDKLYMTCAN